MNVSSTGASPAWPASRSVSTSVSPAAKDAGSTSSESVKSDFLKYAKMSPLERMRANILKSMDLTEEQLGSLPLAQRQKVEDQIKETIKTMMTGSGAKGQLVNLSA
ncbi:hypothetical protein OPKNFCMD_6472 [Methylobacterium crusticola]|uniref:Uncharacterized protein n=1 Tax=Methylobacterium crusticola TaxID=1697972 RepID=A0ABQ4R9Z5_9HYPH|nr:hypothetical protein [Methylobacterium crusticola]GJD53695.1 hypothetical protein OPKNFCMD_6472 [Methylobacterium crusticola]